MNKELERLERLTEYFETYEDDDNDYNEALKCLETLGSVCAEEDVSAKEIFYEEFDTVKQALLKAQKQEKILSIIKEKNLFNPTHKYIVDYSKVYATYSHMFGAYKLDKANKLTSEEFNLFKEWVKNEEKN